MRLIQVYLSDDELELLDRAAAQSGASRSELIRRAVRRLYGNVDLDEKIRQLESTSGGWTDFPVTGEEYVDAIRGDVNERLRRLGVE